MQSIAWTSENEVFIAQIDAEHRDFFQLAGELERLIRAKAPTSENAECLHKLAAHAEEHFSHEEWLMQSIRYPSFGWHREQHNTARRRLKLFQPMIEAGDEEAGEAFLEFVADWLKYHTTVTDRMLAAFVRNYERAHSTGALARWSLPAAPAVGTRRR